MFSKISLIGNIVALLSACGYIICYDDRPVSHITNEYGTSIQIGEPIITVIKKEELCPFELEGSTYTSTETSTETGTSLSQ